MTNGIIGAMNAHNAPHAANMICAMRSPRIRKNSFMTLSELETLSNLDNRCVDRKQRLFRQPLFGIRLVDFRHAGFRAFDGINQDVRPGET